MIFFSFVFPSPPPVYVQYPLCIPPFFPPFFTSPSLSVYLYISILQVGVKPSWWFPGLSHCWSQAPVPFVIPPNFPLPGIQPTYPESPYLVTLLLSFHVYLGKMYVWSRIKNTTVKVGWNLFALEPGLLIYPEIPGFQSNIILTKVKM